MSSHRAIMRSVSKGISSKRAVTPTWPLEGITLATFARVLTSLPNPVALDVVAVGVLDEQGNLEHRRFTMDLYSLPYYFFLHVRPHIFGSAKHFTSTNKQVPCHPALKKACEPPGAEGHCFRQVVG